MNLENPVHSMSVAGRGLLSCLMLSLIAPAAWAACTVAAPECTEWVPIKGGPARFLVYRSQPLGVRNERITRAMLMIHGQNRDADNYYRHALAAGFLADALDDTVIVSLRFASNEGGSCKDALAEDELGWGCLGPDSWRNGGPALGNAAITSYDPVDEILRRLATREAFPNLNAIVVAGHSAGGQYVGRYAMANKVHDELPVPPAYVVANPSSYTYLDDLRPTVSAVPAGFAAAPPGYQAPLPSKPPAPFVSYADAKGCSAYDSWPYGLGKRTGYSARLSDDQLRKQVASRRTVYLLGELDILPLYGFDDSCAAMAQGPTRLARGLAFAKHVNDRHGASDDAQVVPACGHSARCMFTADMSLQLLFPDNEPAADR